MTRTIHLPASVNATQSGLKSYLVKSFKKFIDHIETTILHHLHESILSAHASGKDASAYTADLKIAKISLKELKSCANSLSLISVGIVTLPIEHKQPSDKTIFEKNLFGEDVFVEYLNNVRAVTIDEPVFKTLAAKKHFDAWCNQIDLAVPKD